MQESSSGVEVGYGSGLGQAIERQPTGIAAFVGRSLRGPINQPVIVHSFADFQAAFGGLWKPSPMSYAVDQFFENGGTEAVVVRVANGARGCTLRVETGAEPLLLRAIAPGTREFLRAAVDLDGIGDNEEQRFNLTVQRLRAPGTEQVESQEIFRGLSVDPASSNFIASALAESSLVRLAGDAPRVRPAPTLSATGSVEYAHSRSDGDDGAPLTDYDLIGSAEERTGLFALEGTDAFNFLCLPPHAHEQDIGPGALLVAHRYCVARRAILLTDPPRAWDTPDKALLGSREWILNSEDAVMYFPRLLALDKLRGRFEAFGPSGAVAGMLARADHRSPVWREDLSDVAGLRPGFRPQVVLSDAQREQLANWGVNGLSARRPGAGGGASPRTLAGRALEPHKRELAARRFSLFVLNSIERGTRWAVFEPPGPATWQALTGQVASFLASLEQDGAFAAAKPGERWFVTCDERLNPLTDDEACINLLVGFASGSVPRLSAWLLSHRPGGSQFRPRQLDPVAIGNLLAGAMRPDRAGGETLAEAG
ncbi:MAG: hypothetical protein ACO3WK_04730 [Steroidobacteraceae bacterium]